jgi:hypothetical protein
MYQIRINALFVFCIALFLYQTPLLAQADYRPGYIIKNNGDSVSGYLRYYSDKKSVDQCLFKQTLKKNAEKYTPTDLDAYGFHQNKRFETTVLHTDTLGDKKVFAKRIVKGPLSLLKYNKTFLIQVEGHKGTVVLPIPVEKTVQTKQGLMIQDDRRYIDILNSYLDGSNLSANRTGYNESALTALINNFNKLKGHSPADNPVPLTKFNYEIFSGYMRSDMKMEIGSNTINFSPSVTVIGGLGLDVSSPRIFDRLSLSIQGWYVKAFYQAYSESMYIVDFVREDILMDFTYIKIPVGLRYNFSGPDNTPYFKFGFAPVFLLSSEDRTINEMEFNGTIKVADYRDYRIKNSRGLWLGLGYTKTIVGNMKIFAEIRAEKTNGFVGNAIQSVSSSFNYNFLLGCRF